MGRKEKAGTWQKRRKPSKKPNGFLLGDSLIALLIVMISGFLILSAMSALKKCTELQVHPEMERIEYR